MSIQFCFNQFSLVLFDPGQSGPGKDSNEGGLCIPQSSSITKASLSDCIISRILIVGVLLFCRDVVGVFYRSPTDWARKWLRYFQHEITMNSFCSSNHLMMNHVSCDPLPKKRMPMTDPNIHPSISKDLIFISILPLRSKNDTS